MKFHPKSLLFKGFAVLWISIATFLFFSIQKCEIIHQAIVWMLLCARKKNFDAYSLPFIIWKVHNFSVTNSNWQPTGILNHKRFMETPGLIKKAGQLWTNREQFMQIPSFFYQRKLSSILYTCHTVNQFESQPARISSHFRICCFNRTKFTHVMNHAIKLLTSRANLSCSFRSISSFSW